MRRTRVKRLSIMWLSVWAIGSILVLAGPALAAVGPNLAANSDYAASPPFVASTVPPNVLLLMDNSGSMGLRAYCGTEIGGLGAGNKACDITFLATTAYIGLFDSMKCY